MISWEKNGMLPRGPSVALARSSELRYNFFVVLDSALVKTKITSRPGSRRSRTTAFVHFAGSALSLHSSSFVSTDCSYKD